MTLLDNISKIDGDDPEELVGRYLTNAFGVQEIVTLQRIHWDYLDWLESRGARIKEFIYYCNEDNPDCPFSDALQWWTYWLMEDREKEGLPRPDWLLPMFEE